MCLPLLMVACSWPVLAAPEVPTIRIAVEAEFGHTTSTSAEAIRRGAIVAADEINAAGGVLGRTIEIVSRDDRSVPSRAVENVEELAADPQVIAVLAGKFSPVVEELVPLVDRLEIPLVATWSAADTIVDNGHEHSYVFRVSLTDTWAMGALVAAAERRGLRRVGIIVPNTGWGRSSLAAAERRVARGRGASLVAVAWFNSGDATLLPQYRALLEARVDGVLLVANEGEGAILVRELAGVTAAERRPILAHWGITGGAFAGLAGAALNAVDLSVVQTYSFVGARGAPAVRVIQALRERFGVLDARAIEAPVGVAHAYDAVHLLARAVARAGRADRRAVRDALERLGEYQGLVRTYHRPFTPRRHEALTPGDVFLAGYGAGGVLLPRRSEAP